MPRGLYADLVERGVLHVDAGLQVARPARLMELIVAAGWNPSSMVADSFLAPKLSDAVGRRWPLVFRRRRWSEATDDIAAFRALALDGQLAVETRQPADGRGRSVPLGGRGRHRRQRPAGEDARPSVSARRRDPGRHSRRRSPRPHAIQAAAPTPAGGGVVRRHPARQNPRRWAAVRRAVLEAAGWRCRQCGRYGNEVDHVVPIRQGGAFWPGLAGLQCLCRSCHRIKSDRENPAFDPERQAWRDYLSCLGVPPGNRDASRIP